MSDNMQTRSAAAPAVCEYANVAARRRREAEGFVVNTRVPLQWRRPEAYHQQQLAYGLCVTKGSVYVHPELVMSLEVVDG